MADQATLAECQGRWRWGNELMVHLPHGHHHEEPPVAFAAVGLQREIRNALHEWRSHMAHGMELVEPIDAAHDHILGDPGSAVAVVEYGQLSSPNESREDLALREQLGALVEEERICLTFRHFPIIDSHPGAWLAALAIEAASLQGGFWDLRAALTDAETTPWARELDAQSIASAARELHLDVPRLMHDVDAPGVVAKILRDLYSGIRSGVNGAPTFYVQGIRQDIDATDELLGRIGHAIAGDRAALWPPVHRAPTGLPRTRS